MYKTGDRVAHPGHGGCVVSEVRSENRDGKQVDYLILVPEGDGKIQILAPVGKLKEIGVRDIIPEQQADCLMNSFLEASKKISPDNMKRQKAYQEIIRGDSLDMLANLIKELILHPKLSSNDKSLLDRAQKKLFSEIALVKGVSYQDIVSIAQSRIAQHVPAN